MLLNTTLGTSQVLAHSGGDRLHLLNASAAELWQLHQVNDDEVAARPLIQKLIVDYGLSKAAASSQVEELLLHWRQSGLLADSFERLPDTLAQACDWIIPPPFPATTRSMTLMVRLAGLVVGCLLKTRN